MRGLCWIRRDIRLEDQRALEAACRECDSVVVVYILDGPRTETLAPNARRRLTFVVDSLARLDRGLLAHGSRLLVREGDPRHELLEAVRELNVDRVYFNRDYEPGAKSRDARITEALEGIGCKVTSFKDQVLFEAHELTTGKGGTYKRFAGYRKAWLRKKDDASILSEHPRLERLMSKVELRRAAPDLPTILSERKGPPSLPEFWSSSAQYSGSDLLGRFVRDGLSRYKDDRDHWDLPGTSRLSPHFRFGTVSIRQAVACCSKKGAGPEAWRDELIWRDFYQMTLDQFPHLLDQALDPRYEDLPWKNKTDQFERWKLGQTGYPIVDAAMRALRQDAWLHNRVRMIVATFLVKDLLVDWRWGARHFAEELLDYEPAANAGNWQWCASTGLDAQPWFRVFNPVEQSRRFDPDGSFIARYCPELARFSSRDIHWPHDASSAEQRRVGCILGKDYPRPVVEHREARDRWLAIFA